MGTKSRKSSYRVRTFLPIPSAIVAKPEGGTHAGENGTLSPADEDALQIHFCKQGWAFSVHTFLMLGKRSVDSARLWALGPAPLGHCPDPARGRRDGLCFSA